MADKPEKIVNLPDGRKVHFPGDLTDEQITAIIETEAIQNPPIPEVPGMGVQMPPQTAPGFEESFLNRLGGAAKGAYEIGSALGDVTNPQKTIDLMKGMAQPNIDLLGQAKEQFQAGNFPQAATRGVLGAIPLLGPQVHQWGTQIAAGNIGQTGGEIGADLLMSFLPVAVSKIKGNPTSLLNPVERSAMEFAVRKNIQVDLATATGSPWYSGLKAAVEKMPLAGRRGKEFMIQTNKDLIREGQSLVDQIPGATSRTNLEAGTGLMKAAETKLNDVIAKQRQSYADLDVFAQQNIKPVVTGTQTVPNPQSSILGPNGKPIPAPPTKQVPIVENLAAPVDMRFIKVRARKIQEQFEKTIPQVQRDASPGYQAVKQIADGPDYVALQTAIDNGAATGRISASDLPQVKNASQAIASSINEPLQQQITRTVAAMDPKALELLDQGRAFTKQKWKLSDMKGTLKEEPAAIANKLVKGGDRSINTLKAFEKEFPNEIPNLGRAAIAELLESHTTLGKIRGAGAEQAWSKIGPETKTTLFKDPALIKDLNDYFNTARMVGIDPNPSQSGKVAAIIAGGGLMIRHPISGMLYILGSKRAANLMYGSGGAKLIQRGLTQSAKTKMGMDTALRLWVAANVAEGSQPMEPLEPARLEGQQQ